MIDAALTVSTTFALLGTASFLIILAYLFTTASFTKLSAKKAITAKLAIGAVLGLLAIYATLMGTKLPDGISPNVRELAAIIAGVTAGPFGGLIGGLLGGIHRFTLGGPTALPCSVATIMVGVVAGLVSTKLAGKLYLAKAAVAGFVLESAALGLLFVTMPYDTAVTFASEVYIPMVGATTIGLVLWVYLLNNWKAGNIKKGKAVVS